MVGYNGCQQWVVIFIGLKNIHVVQNSGFIFQLSAVLEWCSSMTDFPTARAYSCADFLQWFFTKIHPVFTQNVGEVDITCFGFRLRRWYFVLSGNDNGVPSSSFCFNLGGILVSTYPVNIPSGSCSCRWIRASQHGPSLTCSGTGLCPLQQWIPLSPW